MELFFPAFNLLNNSVPVESTLPYFSAKSLSSLLKAALSSAVLGMERILLLSYAFLILAIDILIPFDLIILKLINNMSLLVICQVSVYAGASVVLSPYRLL